MRVASFFSVLISRTAALVYLCLFPLVGFLVANIGYCDPDSCWHLALGRWMAEHHTLPLVDPFSSNIKDFVFVASGQPIMQHEWLSDLVFYTVFSLGGPRLLLSFIALVSCLALIVLPSFWLQKSGVPRLTVLTVIAATLPASSFRLWARPEVLSFLCLSALIPLLRFGRKASPRNFLVYFGAVFLLLAFWANCHALFVLGLFYAFVELIFFFAQYLMALSRTAKTELISTLLLTLAAVCGSLCNPWGTGLWRYIFNIVTSSASHSNKENGPLTLTALGEITAVPLVVSFLLAALISIFLVVRKKATFDKLVAPLGLYLTALICAILFRRFSPFALLILSSSLSSLFNGLRGVSPRSDSRSLGLRDCLVVDCQLVFSRLRMPGPVVYILGLFLATSVTWLTTTFIVKADIPSASRFFQPPWHALRYLDVQRPRGRMLNDSKIGSMITFWLSNPPDVFIDGRFDSYSRGLIADYEWMRLAKPGYKDLLSRYHIGWVFFPAAVPIVRALSQDPSWSASYRDSEAVILVRSQDNQTDHLP